MFAGIRGYAQSIANGTMDGTCQIRHKLPYAEDPANPKGDDTLEYEPVLTSSICWYVSSLTKTLNQQGIQVAAAESDTLRLPVGTRIDTGDEVIVEGTTWTVVDASNDETYPAMLKVSITRQT